MLLHQDNSKLPKCIRGFESINRYWDKHAMCYAAKILPGEYYVSLTGEMVVTVLGSCVSACIRDRRLNIGGMNHFMLPMSPGEDSGMTKNVNSDSARYGNVAMEKLINEILKQGGRKQDLEVKVCGGGQIIANMSDIGARNIEFVLSYLETERLDMIAKDLGDIYPRKVQYEPKTGRLRIKKLKSMHNRTILDREQQYLDTIKRKPVKGDVELF